MRFKKYINESEFFTTDKWEELKSVLAQDCKPYIKELSNTSELLLRGVKAPPAHFKKLKVRQDRRPRLVSKDLHQRLDNELNKWFGWKARSSGLFTTTGYRSAKIWGTPTIIFPIGKFKYIWIENVSFLYYGYDNWFSDESHDDAIWRNYIKPSIRKYNDKNLNLLLQTPIPGTDQATECIIKCKEYYSINYEWFDTILKYFG